MTVSAVSVRWTEVPGYSHQSGQILGRDGALLFQHRGQVRLSGAEALAKLGGLPISTICSTHGPVWTENIAKVIGIYDKLSRYAADEGVVIAYGSMYGNTEQMAEAIAAELLHRASRTS